MNPLRCIPTNHALARFSERGPIGRTIYDVFLNSFAVNPASVPWFINNHHGKRQGNPKSYVYRLAEGEHFFVCEPIAANHYRIITYVRKDD